jgi:prepilin-type N-terminal cleavage/methylation domain-containing protein
MKKSFVCRRSARLSGFTLVELLVVMGIIAILAGVLLTAGGAALRAAQRTKAANTANQIQTAALNYYTEYGVYPIPTAAPGDILIADNDTTLWPGMIYGLCGNINPYDASTAAPGNAVPNSRAIAFLSLKSADVDIKNCPLNALPYDKVGHPYFNMVIDNDYSGIVGDSGTGAGATALPNFATSTQGNITYLTKGTTGGIAVWANCNTTAVAAQWNPNFFVHTY